MAYVFKNSIFIEKIVHLLINQYFSNKDTPSIYEFRKNNAYYVEIIAKDSLLCTEINYF